ncbi:MAG: hypothetical protein ACMXX8_01980 [Candidatus Woesearchaeota archaeon]
MLRSKKSAIEVQFNWIFVLIVGGVLLFFVFSVIRSQTETAQYEIDVTIRNYFDTILQRATQARGSLIDLHLRGSTLTSSDSCVDTFYINENRNLRIELSSAFSPKEMGSVSGTFFVWVVPWDLPFRIKNFVYITSPDIVYLLVYEDNDTEDYAVEINYSRNRLSLPRDDKITKIVLHNGSLQGELQKLNHLTTRVVFFKTNCNGVPMPNNANTAICLEIDSDKGGLDGWGKVKYLEPDNLNKETYFLGRPSLIGAIISEDITQFDCSMQKAYIKAEQLFNIYKERSSNLTISDPTPNCNNIHARAENRLEDMINCINNNDNYETIEECLYDATFSGAGSLSGINQESKLRSCVYVY